MTEAQQKAQVINNIENNPQIPASVKATAIAEVKGGPVGGSTAGQVSQPGQPSNAQLQNGIAQIQADPRIPATQKQQIIAQIKQHMQ